MLSDRFQVGRPGDHLMGIPFECDLCHFRNLNGRDPCDSSSKDRYTLLVIRRAMLDACWSRERSTVTGNLSRLILDYTSGMKSLSIEKCPLPVLGSDEVKDRVGMGPALLMLHASTREGKYSHRLQHDTVRRSATWFNNAQEAGERAAAGVVLSNQTSKFHITEGIHVSRWSERLLQGMKRRTGVFRKQDEPLTMAQLLGILEMGDADWQAARTTHEQKRIEELMCFLIVGFMLSLRGEEIPLTDLEGIVSYWADGRDATIWNLPRHIMITLKGRFKGEDNLRWHLMPIPDDTASLVPTRVWMSRLVYRLIQSGRHSGPLFAKKSGAKATIGDYDPLFRTYLARLRALRGGLFFKEVDVADFSARRSLRRGSTQHATNQGVSQQVIDEANRWRTKEAARGSEAYLPLRQVYTSVRHVLPTRLRYPQSL